MPSLFCCTPSLLLSRGLRRLAAATATIVLLALCAAAPAQQAQLSYTQGTTINTASASSSAPTTVGVDGAGNVYFLANGTIYKATPGSSTYALTSTAIAVAGGSYVVVDTNGVLYVSSSASTGTVQTLLTRYTPLGSGYSPTVVVTAARTTMYGLSVDPAGNVFFVVDTPNAFYVREVVAGGTGSSDLVQFNTAVTTFTVDSNDNLFFNYVGQDGVVSEIPKVNNAYSYGNYITPITALCHTTSGCSISALAADSNGNVYSSYITDGSGGSERYFPTGSNTFSAGVVFTGSQSPKGIAVGATGTVYTIDQTSNNIVTHLPPQATNFGTVNTSGHDPMSQSGTVTFVLDASTVYQGLTYVEQGGGSSFSQSSSATCGTSQCSSGTTYSAGTIVSVPSSFLSYTVGSHYGALELNSTSATIATAFLTGSVSAPNLTFLPAVASTVTQAANSFTLRTPAAVATDEAGTAYVIDTGTQALVKVVPGSGQTTNLAGGLNVTSATTAAPALDAAGNVYFVQADPAHPSFFEVSRVNTPDGGSTYTSTAVVKASLTSPKGIAVDATGDLFVLDSSTNQVTEYVNINGSYLPRIVLSNLANVQGLAVGSDGSLYIATTPGLLKSTPLNGIYGTPVAITPSADTAYGVTLDSVGNIYVNDAGNGRVLRLSADASVVTTLYTSSNATISGLAATPAGNVLLAESSTSTLSLLTLSTPPSLTFASTPVGSSSSDSPQTITFLNSGNAPLFSNSSSGGSSTITGPFSLGSASTCPQDFSHGGLVLAQNASCTYLVSFTPTATGVATGSLQTIYAGGYGYELPTLTDALSGTGTAATPTVAVTNATQPYATNDTMLNATVTYNGPTPTGNVTFSINTPTPITVAAQQCLQGANNTRSCTGRPNVQAVPAGTYTITVTEASDANYTVASGTGTLTITKQTVTPSAVTMPASVPYGSSSITLASYTGYPSANAAGPTGNLNFTVDNSINVTANCGTTNARACTATYSPSTLSVGTHTLSATLAADTNYTTASSGSGATFTITVGTPTGTVNASTVSYGAQSTPLTATFAYAGPTAPTGLVTFSVNGASPVNATCTGTSSPRTCSVTYDTSALAAGSYTVQASEAADSNYAAATASGSLTVSTGAPAISVPSMSVVYGSTSATLTATVTFTGSTPPTGQVTFSVNNGSVVQSNSCQVNGSSRTCTASYPLPALSGGSYTIQATQAADGNFGGATGSGTLTVTPAAPTVTPSAVTATYGSSSIQLTASVAYTGSAAPTGQPAFTVNSSTLVPATCTGNTSPRTCTGTFSPANLGAGQYPVTFSEGSDTNYSSSTSTATTLTVTKATPTITASNATISYGASPTTLTAVVSYTGSTSPSTQPAFSLDGGPAISARCSGSSPTLTCTATANTASLTVGSHTLVASLAADANYNAVTSAAATLTVTPGAATLSLNPVTGSAGGSAITLTASQTFSAAAPTGSVSFQVNGTTLAANCIGTTSPRSCSATLDVSRLPAGTYNYTASSAGDTNYIAATSNTSTVTLSSSAVTLTALPVTSTYGTTPLSLSATLAYSGTAAPTGAVSFLIDGATRVTANCSGNASPQSCTGSYTGAALTAGTHTLSATYVGDTTYAAASSGNVAITINLAPLMATVSPASTTYGAATTVLNATVNFSGPVAPTGSVHLQVNGGTAVTAFCSAGNSSLLCSANFQSSSLAVGQYPVVALVAADSNYSAITSAAATLSVGKATPVISLATVITPYGATAVNLVATFSNLQAAVPTGSASFLIDGNATATPACSFAGATGTCTVSYNASALAVGSHTLVVTEPADVNYNQSTASTTLNITQGTPQVTAPAVTVPSGSSSATLTATVAYTGVAAPTGAVTFTLAGSNPIAATCAGTASPLSCAAAISLSSVPAGAYTLTAAVAADTNYAAAAARTSLTISPGAATTFPTCTLGSIKSVSSTSNAVSVTATCTDPGGLALNTTINWGDGTPVVPAVNNGTNTHTYVAPPVQTTYTTVLTATNTAGSTGSAVQDVTVVPIVTVAAASSANVSTTFAAQPPAVPVLQVTFLCTSVSTSVSGQSVTNALPSSYGITCTSPTVSSSSSGPAQVTIKTTSSTVAMLMRASRSTLVEALLLPLLGLPFFARGGVRRRGALLCLAVLSLAGLSLGLSGCGGSFQAPPTLTPKGSYYITITEVTASGATPPTGFVQTSLIVPLTVQ